MKMYVVKATGQLINALSTPDVLEHSIEQSLHLHMTGSFTQKMYSLITVSIGRQDNWHYPYRHSYKHAVLT